MEEYRVKDLMVPLSDYATVSGNATLLEAVIALEKAQEGFDHSRYRHPFLLLVGAAPNAIAYDSKQFTIWEFLLYGIPASIILMPLIFMASHGDANHYPLNRREA